MRDAGAIAGLNVLRFINGSTAASIAHGFDMTKSIPRNVLVFDCGGGTLDVSLLVIDEGTFEVKATAGDSHSGGMDFDNRLLKHFVDELMLNYQQDLRSNNRAMVRLLGACEQAKRGLSASVEAYIDLDGLCEGVSFKSTIARTKYENLCSDLLAKLLHPVERVLRDAKRSKSMVDEVIAVGGLAHVLKVQQLLSDYFDGKILSKPIRPDNAAVTGVTAQTAILSNELPSNVSNVVLLDVIPLSLGVEIDGKSRQ